MKNALAFIRTSTDRQDLALQRMDIERLKGLLRAPLLRLRRGVEPRPVCKDDDGSKCKEKRKNRLPLPKEREREETPRPATSWALAPRGQKKKGTKK